MTGARLAASSAPPPLHFVGDGERDAATVPPLVELLLGAQVTAAATSRWAHLHAARHGYDRKLLFSMRAAVDAGAAGLVATVDRDKARTRERLREMIAARERERSRAAAAATLPVALGEAVPHGEAWLLDDPVAVRTALQLDGATEVPSPTRVASPKDALQALHEGSPERQQEPLVVLVSIARGVEPARCVHARETGFEAFSADVRRELGPLVNPPRR